MVVVKTFETCPLQKPSIKKAKSAVLHAPTPFETHFSQNPLSQCEVRGCNTDHAAAACNFSVRASRSGGQRDRGAGCVGNFRPVI